MDLDIDHLGITSRTSFDNNVVPYFVHQLLRKEDYMMVRSTPEYMKIKRRWYCTTIENIAD